MLAAVLHILVIFGGPDWYRFFGAGEQMAQAAERGSWMPPAVTLAIAAVLVIWALYAFSGAGRVGRMPLLRTGLVVIAAIYLLRGIVLIPALVRAAYPGSTFDIVSSAIVLVYGAAYAIGTWQAWPALSPRRSAAA